MSPRNPKDAARHYARPHHTVSSDPTQRPARRERLLEFDDFDVDAAFAPGYDFAQAFADLDAPLPEAVTPIRPHRSRVAFAAAVTAVALPLLAIDNLGATADEGGVDSVREAIESTADAPAAITAVRAQIVVDESTMPTMATTTTVAPTTTVAVAAAVAESTTTAAPTTTTTVKPTTTTVKPTTTTTAKPLPVKGDPDSAATWEELADCESNGNWSANTGNGYYGGLQFSQASWENVGGTGLPSEAPKATQIEMGKRLQARQGWAAWPTCARQLGFIS